MVVRVRCVCVDVLQFLVGAVLSTPRKKDKNAMHD